MKNENLPVGVSAIILAKFGYTTKTVLTLRSENCRSMHNLWLFPGGGVEANEHPLDALKREVLEEVGLHIVPLNLQRPTVLDVDDQWWLNLSYICSVDYTQNGDMDLKNMEPNKFHKVEWHDIYNLPENCSCIVKEFISTLYTNSTGILIPTIKERSIK